MTEEDLLRKRLVMGLLEECVQARDNLQMERLVQAVETKARKKASSLKRLGGLLNRYKEHKVNFGEETFTLFDLAGFVHMELTDPGENELMFLLVAKFKVAINRAAGRHDDEEVDPRKPHEVAELDAVFDTLCSKNQKEVTVLSGFLEE